MSASVEVAPPPRALKLEAEIQEIKALVKPDGLVTPEELVRRAMDPKSALHGHFTWDDDEAARKFRLVEAAMLIRKCKIFIQPDPNLPPIQVRAAVSLASDRINGGGYRLFSTVMNSDEMKAELLRTARAELDNFVRKYSQISELASVVDAAKVVLEPPKKGE